MTRISIIFVQEFVIGIGFLNGLWIYTGVNPETEILKAFTASIPEMSSLLFWIGVLILTVIPIAATYLIGKWLGLLAVFLAFIGGILIASWGIWPLMIGIIMGLFAPFTGVLSTEV